jgi:hypothetical protein
MSSRFDIEYRRSGDFVPFTYLSKGKAALKRKPFHMACRFLGENCPTNAFGGASMLAIGARSRGLP